MAPYRIHLLGHDGSIAHERVVECQDDDEAIELTGKSDHPHEMLVWQAERLVARFPPWPPLRRL
ncbi:MAG TPA: hypothetical protein VMT68_17000 [Caulobacteraceae bacterium]|nr:hypothetical protein [Caulobacteraceae bacterium]